MRALGFLAFLAALALGACAEDDSRPRLPECAEPMPEAVVDVDSTYRYTDPLRGTITLEQDGDEVNVVNTTYENADDRPLVGSGTLAGNVLEMRMLPENGETDYEAQVEFVFDEDGDAFCVEFSDTNGDRGPLGSYTGRRL